MAASGDGRGDDVARCVDVRTSSGAGELWRRAASCLPRRKPMNELDLCDDVAEADGAVMGVPLGGEPTLVLTEPRRLVRLLGRANSSCAVSSVPPPDDMSLNDDVLLYVLSLDVVGLSSMESFVSSSLSSSCTAPYTIDRCLTTTFVLDLTRAALVDDEERSGDDALFDGTVPTSD